MKIEKKTLQLPEGDRRAPMTIYDSKDIPMLFEIYSTWRKLCQQLNKLNARSANLPDGLSEISFAISHDMWRCTSNIKGANSSFDCYDPNGQKNNNRVQVKACSVHPDLTSFGPRTQYDRIFFSDFYRDGNWDGTFDVYELDVSDIETCLVNASETVETQKDQKRRPRFSILDSLIKKNKYKSKNTYKITQTTIEKV